MIPVDLVVNSIVYLGYYTAMNPPKETDLVPIYQQCSSSTNPMTWDDVRLTGNDYFSRRPLDRKVLPNYLGVVKTAAAFKALHFLTGTIPATIFDIKTYLFRHSLSLSLDLIPITYFTGHWKERNPK